LGQISAKSGGNFLHNPDNKPTYKQTSADYHRISFAEVKTKKDLKHLDKYPIKLGEIYLVNPNKNLLKTQPQKSTKI